MDEHPLVNVMKTAMTNLNEMVDVNKIVGDAVETPDGNVIIPVSRITLGFLAGGTSTEGDEENGGKQNNNGSKSSSPEGLFGGGSGGGISLQPVAFLIVGHGQVRLLPVNSNAMLDRLIDLAPGILNILQGIIGEALKDNGNDNKKNDNKRQE